MAYKSGRVPLDLNTLFIRLVTWSYSEVTLSPCVSLSVYLSVSMLQVTTLLGFGNLGNEFSCLVANIILYYSEKKCAGI